MTESYATPHETRFLFKPNPANTIANNLRGIKNNSKIEDGEKIITDAAAAKPLATPTVEMTFVVFETAGALTITWAFVAVSLIVSM